MAKTACRRILELRHPKNLLLSRPFAISTVKPSPRAPANEIAPNNKPSVARLAWGSKSGVAGFQEMPR
jgi:hypothetical protein